MPPEAMLARAAEHAALRRGAKHHAMLAALSGSAPAFPAAAQLASRWVSAHMLSNHITEPMSELLTAAAFSADRAALIPGTLLKSQATSFKHKAETVYAYTLISASWRLSPSDRLKQRAFECWATGVSCVRSFWWSRKVVFDVCCGCWQ